MKVDLHKPVLDLDGEPVKDGDKVVLVRHVCCNALLAPSKNEQTGEEKVKLFKLATKISDGCDDLSVEDIALLKKLIGALFPPLVVGRCFEVLDPEPQVRMKAIQ